MENRVFKRKIYSQMAEWKEISKESTALLVEGGSPYWKVNYRRRICQE